MTKTRVSTVSVVAGLLALPAGAQAASPLGVWINDTGRGAIEIKKCGGALCGHVVWVKSEADTKGCGKQILGEVQAQGAGRWDGGWIYSPEKKRRYDVELTPLGEGRLQVVGYAGVKLFSKTMIWTRAPADLRRCGETVTADAAPPQKAEATTTAPAVTTPAVKTEATAAPARITQATPPAKSALPASNSPASAAASSPAPANSPTPQATPARSPSPVENGSGTAPGTRTQEGARPDDQSAAAETHEAGDAEDDHPAGASPASGNKLSLGDIDLDQFLKRTGDGRCKLDLPWVKVKFDCER